MGVWLVFAASDTTYPRMRHLCFIAGAACDDSFGSCVYQTLRKGRFFNANGYNVRDKLLVLIDEVFPGRERSGAIHVIDLVRDSSY